MCGIAKWLPEVEFEKLVCKIVSINNFECSTRLGTILVFLSFTFITEKNRGEIMSIMMNPRETLKQS